MRESRKEGLCVFTTDARPSSPRNSISVFMRGSTPERDPMFVESKVVVSGFDGDRDSEAIHGNSMDAERANPGQVKILIPTKLV
mmetsp:Transcript_16845/g.34843  ORF Transcript_16845/g.34843 Transcript_16845/m.34843 type:complete len:84 (-) Transcript_16845:929-1180(-)